MASSTTLKEVRNHLSDVANEPLKPLNQKLLESVDSLAIGMNDQVQLCFKLTFCNVEKISETDQDALITQLAELVPKLQQDPTPVTQLIEYLTRPPTFDFHRVLAIKPEIDFVAGLSAPLPSINLITLRLLRKACSTQGAADMIAGKPDVVAALVRLWLRSIDIAVVQMCLETLLGLLIVGGEGASHRQLIDENLMWRRLFRDRDIYGSIFALCSLKTVGQDGQLSKHDKTSAQARLLDLLLEIDSEPVRRSQFPDIEQIYDVVDGGLLKFATIHMVDFSDDIIMHLNLIHFFAEFLRSRSPMSDSSKALSFLVETGLHSRTLSYYIEPSKHAQPDQSFLYGSSANYISTYASSCPSHLLSQSSLLEAILGRLSMLFEGLTLISTVQAESFKHDLQVLVSLPQAALRTKPQLEIIAATLDRDDEVQRPVNSGGGQSQTLTLGR